MIPAIYASSLLVVVLGVYLFWRSCGGLAAMWRGDHSMMQVSRAGMSVIAASQILRHWLLVTWNISAVHTQGAWMTVAVSLTTGVALFLFIWLDHLVRKSGLNEAHAIYRHAAEAMAITELADFDNEAAAELAATARRMLAERLANALRSNVA
jgi:ABC-type branched-subunit amino acid transport system ATPase component